MDFPVKVFVLHVKKGYEDRAEHMEKMLGGMGIPFEYVLDWDMPDLTEEIVLRYFKGDCYGRVCPATSCAMKHQEAYNRMLRDDIPYALVLEDDMFLKKNFVKVFMAAFEEVKKSNGTDKPFWLSLEATGMGFTPRSRRRKGQYVYPGRFIQCAGSYLVNKSLAKVAVDTISAEKSDLGADHYLDSLLARGLADGYWVHPAIAEQGTHTGRMKSAIGNPHDNKRFMRIRRKLTFLYKDILYFFR